MGYFKCISNKDGKVVLVHSLGPNGEKYGRITFDENERFAEKQIQEGEIATVSYSFSKATGISDVEFPEE